MKTTSDKNISPPCYMTAGENRCTGCAACANGCHRAAIRMRLNSLGFYRPMLRDQQCDNCGECLHQCPAIVFSGKSIPHGIEQYHWTAPEIYAAWTRDKEVHATSSSGGLFSELARYILNRSGIVCGCEWGDNWTPRHVMVDQWSEVPRLRGAKYVPSHMNHRFYRKIGKLSAAGRPVLFCGTPCQVAGLETTLPSGARPNLIMVDLVCHGVPSLHSFHRYLEWKFKDMDRIRYFSFRSKEISSQTICGITHDGSKYVNAPGRDPWFRSTMVWHLFLQKSCFDCSFSDLPRRGDLSLGDFWGIPAQWHHPEGDSVVLANSPRGKAIMRRLIRDNRIRVKPSDYPTASAKNRRLRGAVYPYPILRNLSLRCMSGNGSFKRFYRSIYLPILFFERLSTAAIRRLKALRHPLPRLREQV